MGKTIVVTNRKGGCGKSTTAANLGIGLARHGKRALLIDADSQHSLTVSLGVAEPDKLPTTVADVLADIIAEKDIDPTAGIIHHPESVDLLPANNSLRGIELALAPLIGRENVLRNYIEKISPLYEYIIIDTAPTLDLMTVNALAAADSAIIPVTPKYLDVKGLELLLRSIAQVKRQINPALGIAGIIFTMADRRANFTKEIISLVENAYGENIKIFNEHIPRSVRVAESSAYGKSIFAHAPRGNVAMAYSALVEEVLRCA